MERCTFLNFSLLYVALLTLGKKEGKPHINDVKPADRISEGTSIVGLNSKSTAAADVAQSAAAAISTYSSSSHSTPCVDLHPI